MPKLGHLGALQLAIYQNFCGGLILVTINDLAMQGTLGDQVTRRRVHANADALVIVSVILGLA